MKKFLVSMFSKEMPPSAATVVPENAISPSATISLVKKASKAPEVFGYQANTKKIHARSMSTEKVLLSWRIVKEVGTDEFLLQRTGHHHGPVIRRRVTLTPGFFS
jgi:hypothetical protein